MQFTFDKNDFLSYVDMAECIKNGRAAIVHDSADGLFLYEQKSGIYMLALDKMDGAGNVFNGFSFD